MRNNISRMLSLLLFASVITWVGCKKNTDVAVPVEQAHFMNVSSGTYQITAPGVVYKIPIGITTASNTDRTVKIAITSPTGAVQGTHYTVNKSTFTIPAGKVVDTLVITGTYAQYTAGRKDTLVITMQGLDKGSSVGASDYNGVFTLFMRGPCAEQEIVTGPASLNGSYKSTERGYNETTGALTYTYAPGGGYLSGVTSATTLSPTTTRVTISNIWEMGPTITAKFILDYSNFAARTVTVDGPQKVGPGTLVGLSAAYDLYVMPATGANPAPDEGTYTYCSNNIVIKYRVGAYAAGTSTFLGYVTSTGSSSVFTQTLVKQ